MELNETQQHYFTSNTVTGTATPSPTNGLLLPNEREGGSHHMVYPHSVPPAVTSTLEPARRKRGRPRKYGTPEQALTAKKMASFSSKVRRELQQQQQQQLDLGGGGGSLKKSQLVALGNAGQGFTPHVVDVVSGEDVGQKVLMFMQQSKREVCILSASGTISNASLRQPATSGGNIAYEGRFEIISLSGSYVRNEIGGRTGGLSVCLSSADGQIIGGGVGGPLKAAGPVQVIVGTFTINNKKDVSAGAKGDASGSKLPYTVGGNSTSNVAFRSAFETSGRNPIPGNDDYQSFGGSHFVMQPRGMHMAPRSSDWRISLDDRTGFELTGKTGQSPQNEDYDQLAG
ncbi:AT-hook motif nuclear-localized protein 14 [Hibiscus syriacus]|uniref:AT-hook motif nuclear-localized protein n=1 Tax=Hibiscus syriacus TaxID=106335 RepID=A0A6A2XMZ7_HIBSY|nr:AT-hook motif nuclear-localized protein 14-like isoform X1 [Hibiscus syriacus]KAE8677771.1 AT-hook motif nuclear-localized protein 14 [Hibiscus syriacus]